MSAAAVARVADANRWPGEVAWSDAPPDVPLWGVFGPDCFPTVFACQLQEHPEVGRVIWGSSADQGKRAYRTLGVGRAWADERGLRLFWSRSTAFDYVASLLA